MRLTVFAAANEGFAGTTAPDRADVSKWLDSVKHLLWHGNVDEALERVVSDPREVYFRFGDIYYSLFTKRAQ